jgi:hypothetical protein
MLPQLFFINIMDYFYCFFVFGLRGLQFTSVGIWYVSRSVTWRMGQELECIKFS